MIKAIAFDYGGVIRLNGGNLLGEVCDYLNIGIEEWQEQYYKLNYLANVENKSFPEVFTLVASRFNDSKETKNNIIKIVKENSSQSYLNKGLIDIVKILKNKNYKIALLSNNSLDLKDRLIKDGIIDLFDSVIISAEVGYQKPDPEIFNILFFNLNLTPREVVFIDDSSRSLEGSRKIGYTPILFKDNQTLKKDLYEILQIEI